MSRCALAPPSPELVALIPIDALPTWDMDLIVDQQGNLSQVQGLIQHVNDKIAMVLGPPDHLLGAPNCRCVATPFKSVGEELAAYGLLSDELKHDDRVDALVYSLVQIHGDRRE